MADKRLGVPETSDKKRFYLYKRHSLPARIMQSLNLDSSVADGRVTRRPSSPALLPQGEGRKLPLLGGEGWGEGKRLI